MNEQSFMCELGKNIRYYRLQRGLTQGELAEKINKCLASVSKYERGACAIDIYTIFTIADVLGITAAQLLPYTGASSGRVQSVSSENAHPITNNSLFYLHYIGNSSGKLRMSVLDIDWQSNSVTMYVGVQNKQQFNQCSLLLTGTVDCATAFTSIWVKNPSAPVDFFHIVINGADWYLGNYTCMICYVNSNWRTVTSKAVITVTPDCPKDIHEILAFDRGSLKKFRDLSQLVL